MTAEAAAHNISALHANHLSAYVLPDFRPLVKMLAEQGVQIEVADDYDSRFCDLLDRFSVRPMCRSMNPVQLLQQPLPQPLSQGPQDLAASLKMYCHDGDVIEVAVNYHTAVMAAMTNEYAYRAYEPGVPEAENVTEQMHGLESGSLALQFGLPMDYVLAAALHDIARVTHADDQHGHRYHAEEGHLLLLPLQLPAYCKDHAFAKWLLNLASPLYREHLISPVSVASLKMQADNPAERFADVIARLNAMTSAQQAFTLHSLMLMRLLLDDFAKVPLSALDDQQYLLTVSQLSDLVALRLVERFETMAELDSAAFDDFKQQVKACAPYWLRV